MSAQLVAILMAPPPYPTTRFEAVTSAQREGIQRAAPPFRTSPSVAPTFVLQEATQGEAHPSHGTHCVSAGRVEKGTTEVQCQVPQDLPKLDKSMKIN